MTSPQMLPDAQTLLFTLGANTDSRDRWDQARIVVQSLRSGERKTVFQGASHGRYVPSGHLVFARGGVLFAVRFDVKRLEAIGREVPVAEGVWRGALVPIAAALFGVSNTGSLVYVPGPAAPSYQSGLAFIDRKAVVEPLKIPPGVYEYPRVSPDGTRIVFGTSNGTNAVIATYELSGASMVRQLTFEGNNRYPIWSPDGSRVAFQSDRLGAPAVFVQRADGSGTAEPITTPDPGTSHTPESWSPDGDVLLFGATKGSISSLWTYSFKDRKATPFGGVKDSTLPTDAMFSPNDGRWVAYQMGRPGVTEGSTYVQPFPPDGTRHLIAQEGGRPLWSRDGKQLFFVPAPLQFSVVDVRTSPGFTVTSPVALPRGFGSAAPYTPRTFDIMPDGRLVAVVNAGPIQDGTPAQAQVQEIRVVLNWFEELRSKLPTP